MNYLSSFHIEFVKPLQLPFSLLKKFNIRFFDNETSKLRKYWPFLFLVPLLTIFIISTALYICKIFSTAGNLSERVYLIAVIVVSTQCIVKAVVIIYKLAEIEKLLTDLSSIWRTSNLTKEQKLKKKSFMKHLNYCQFIYYWSNMLSAVQHLYSPLVMVLIRRFILGNDCELKLPFGGVLPYDPTESWLKYLLTYAFQSFTVFCEVQAYIGADFLMITLCAYLTVQFKLLREDLLHAAPKIESNHINSQLAFERQLTTETYTNISIQDIIRRHQKLIGLANDLDDIFNKMVVVNFTFISIITCFFGFTAVVSQGGMEKSHNFIAVCALLLPVYLFCYYGESLKEESLGIADSAYTNQWYKEDIRYQKIIMFIITRSQRPCCMTAMKRVPITLNTFTKVLSSTWSYFSLLTSVYLTDE